MFGKKDEDGADCPLWRAPCKQHKCRWFIQVIGHNPNTGVKENRYDCAIAWLPIMQIETSQQARQAGASSDKVATEVAKFHRSMVQMNNVAIQQQKANGLLEGPDD